MHDAVMAEFGGSLVDDSVEAEAARDEIMTPDPNMSAGMTGNEIEPEEFQPRPQCAKGTLGISVSLVRM